MEAIAVIYIHVLESCSIDAQKFQCINFGQYSLQKK